MQLFNSSTEFVIHTAPFNFLIRSNSTKFYQQVQALYPAQLLTQNDHNQVIDFVVDFNRSWWSVSQAFAFRLGSQHFRFCHQEQMCSVLEWGMNWCISSYQHRYLCIHAAVLEKDNKAIILPAPPGSGKSTLCAILMQEGWRLLSDEHCLIDPASGQLVPCVRPISLKNRSLAVIQQRYPTAQINVIQQNTLKGTIGYLAPSEISWQQNLQKTEPAVIVFPKYDSDTATTLLEPIEQSTLLMHLALNSFNYSALGKQGFDVLSHLVSRCPGYSLVYADTDDMLLKIKALLV